MCSEEALFLSSENVSGAYTSDAGEIPKRTQTSKSDVNVTVHHDKFLIIKPSRCTRSSNLFLEGNSTGLLTACEQAVSKLV